jgi:SSS family solute:Na+ symporter
LCAAQGFVAVTTFRLAEIDVGVYSGLVALGVNLAVVVALTPVLDRFGVSRGMDSTWSPARGAPRREWEVSS